MNKQSKLSVNSPEARAIANHIHPYTNPELIKNDGPHIITSGQGIYVTDSNNKSFIEGMSGLWCTSFGYNENELIDAAITQLRKLPFYHSFTGKTVDPAIDLAEKLISIAPECDLDKVFFCNSGSEANDTAVKMIWYYFASKGKPQKRKIIGRRRGYHGVTVVAASLTGLPYAQDGFGIPLDFAKHTLSPHFFADSLEGESESSFVERLMSELESLIEKEGSDTIGAMFAEPVMGAGGVIVPPKGYFDALQKLLRKHDILLVADEVICGFGRTGNMWGSQTFDIKPDILTCAKALSSSYLPISAVMASSEIVEGVEKQAAKLGIFGHGYTYSASPVPAAVALRTLELMEERKIIDHVKKMEPIFAERVKALGGYSSVGHVRSVGLIGAMEFVCEPGTRKKFDPGLKFSVKASKAIQEEGVILRSLPHDTIGFCPPLIIEEKQIHEMFDKIEKAMPLIDKMAIEFNN